jgi:predicted neuraminidase
MRKAHRSLQGTPVKTALRILSLFVSLLPEGYAQALHEEEFVFDPGAESHGHVHASCLVECPNGDLLVAWYENGPKLASYEYLTDNDKSDDVRIAGARRAGGATAWDRPFVMSDTFGVSDNNPVMVIDMQHRLWLLHAILLAVPQRSWGSSLLRYKISADYEKPGPPKWDREGLLVVHPKGLDEVVARFASGRQAKRLRERLRDPFARRLGWMPRAHPLVLPDGTVLVPLGNENFDVATMTLTTDGGETWTFALTIPGWGVSQPSVVRLASGKLVAFFRDESPDRRVKRSESLDGGLTWSEVRSTKLPNPGSGIEAVMLRNGHLVMIYNDRENRRDRLAVSISTDEGETWKWTRHLEDQPQGRFDYPSLIQAKDGTLHATYSYSVRTIKHVRFNEDWVQQGN